MEVICKSYDNSMTIRPKGPLKHILEQVKCFSNIMNKQVASPVLGLGGHKISEPTIVALCMSEEKLVQAIEERKEGETKFGHCWSGIL